MFALCGPPQSLEHICGIPLQKYVAHCGIIFALWGPPHSFTGLTRSVHMPPLGDPLAATVNDQGVFDITAFCGWAGGLNLLGKFGSGYQADGSMCGGWECRLDRFTMGATWMEGWCGGIPGRTFLAGDRDRMAICDWYVT